MANDSIASEKKKYLNLEDLDVYNSTMGVTRVHLNLFGLQPHTCGADIVYKVKVKVNQSHYRSGVAQRVPGS